MEKVRWEIRAVTERDQPSLLTLARHLDSVNLPHDPEAMKPIIERSRLSFSGNIGDARKREYVFVLYDHEDQRAVGTSMIVGQLGRRGAPYIFLDVQKEERYSHTLDKHFIHDVLSIGYSYDGPTEIGGLVMHPDYRMASARLGAQISYVRFLWIATHRADFQNYVLAELLPPLQPDGTSHLWEALGRRFTGMTYREADRLSKTNKEFIRGLFPDGDLYVTLLEDDARSVIGQVGMQTKGVEKMLRRIGFKYINRVDPFDGGPHFAAKVDEVTLVQNTSTLRAIGDLRERAPRALIAIERDRHPWVRVVCAPHVLEGDAVRIPPVVFDHLELDSDDHVHVLPMR